MATLVAIDVVNAASNASIDDLVSGYAGRAALTVSIGSGTLPRDAVVTARRVAGVTAAAGSIQSALLVGADHRTALPFIAGIGDDAAVRERAFERGAAPVRDELALGREAARRLGAGMGSTIAALTPSGLRELRVSGILAESGVGRANATFVALLDADTADRIALKDGRIDTVDVATAPQADLDPIAAALREAFPGATVETAAARGAQTKKLIALLQDLLRIVSALALFIGTFLVFNTMSTAVAQRRQELVHVPTYVSRFLDTGVDSFAVMIEDRSREASVRRALEGFEGGSLFVQSNSEFKAGIRKLVDDYFSTTYVMEAIALIVGVLGVANTMLVAIIERRREIGVLRAVGATRRQIRRTVLIEAAAIGAAGALLGLAGGAAVAGMTIVVSESTSGWVIPYHYEWPSAIVVTVLSVLAALAAGWWPARAASHQEVATALAYE